MYTLNAQIGLVNRPAIRGGGILGILTATRHRGVVKVQIAQASDGGELGNAKMMIKERKRPAVLI